MAFKLKTLSGLIVVALNIKTAGGIVPVALHVKTLGGIKRVNSGAMTPPRIVRSTGITEAGDATAGYTYTGTSAGFTNFGIVDYALPSGVDGYYEFVQPATAHNGMIGLTTTNTPSLYSGSPGIFWGLYADIGGSNKYKAINNRAAVTATVLVTPAAGDVVRIRIAGTSIFAEVSKDSGVTYTVIYEWTGVTVQNRYCLVNLTNTGVFSGLKASGVDVSLYATHNIVFDGNSLVAGTGSTGGKTLPVQTAKLRPVNGTLTLTNLGIGGQTLRMMNGLDTGSSADVDAAWVSGRVNVLVVWEATNSITVTTRTAAQSLQDLADYIAARQAVHTWDKVVVIGTIPRYQTGTSWASVDDINAQLDSFNASLVASPATYGATAYVDVRPVGGPFALPDYALATFERTETLPLWATTDTVGWRIHLSDAGYAYVAGLVAPKLQQVI